MYANQRRRPTAHDPIVWPRIVTMLRPGSTWIPLGRQLAAAGCLLLSVKDRFRPEAVVRHRLLPARSGNPYLDRHASQRSALLSEERLATETLQRWDTAKPCPRWPSLG